MKTPKTEVTFIESKDKLRTETGEPMFQSQYKKKQWQVLCMAYLGLLLLTFTTFLSYNVICLSELVNVVHTSLKRTAPI